MKRARNRILASGAVLVIASGLAIAPASAQKLYKWVDEQGNVTYQDQPPPGEARKVDEYTAPIEESGTQSGAPVTLYSLPTCDACDLVRLLLQKNSVPFTEKNPSEDQAAAAELREKSGQLSVPSLTVGDKLLMGYNSLAIRDELKDAGYTLQDEAQAPAGEETQAAGGQPDGAPSESTAEPGPDQQAEAPAGSPPADDAAAPPEQAAQQ